MNRYYAQQCKTANNIKRRASFSFSFELHVFPSYQFSTALGQIASVLFVFFIPVYCHSYIFSALSCLAALWYSCYLIPRLSILSIYSNFSKPCPFPELIIIKKEVSFTRNSLFNFAFYRLRVFILRAVSVSTSIRMYRQPIVMKIAGQPKASLTKPNADA